MEGDKLFLYFTAALDVSNILENSFQLYQSGIEVPIVTTDLIDQGFTIKVKSSQQLQIEKLSIEFQKKPVSKTGIPLTYWASTIAIGEEILKQPDLSVINEISNEDRISALLNNLNIVITPSTRQGHIGFEVHDNSHTLNNKQYGLEILDTSGDLVESLQIEKESDIKHFGLLDSSQITPGIYLAKLSSEEVSCTNLFVVHHYDNLK